MKFGQIYAHLLKKSQGQLGDHWFLDEVFIKINGRRHYLWRAPIKKACPMSGAQPMSEASALAEASVLGITIHWKSWFRRNATREQH